MGLARRKNDSGTPRAPLTRGEIRRVFSRLPRARRARDFRIVSYTMVVLAAIIPALVWNSLSIPGNTWSEPALPFYGPIVLIGGIVLLEVALILWVKMLQFGNERVEQHRRQQDPVGEPKAGGFSRSSVVDAPESATRTGGIPRVLVVDDDPINRMILRKQLMRLNVEPVSAADGMEALDTIQRGHWDMILMDGQMPRLDGPEAALEIRLRQLLPLDIPIIGITTNDTPEFRERCLKAGMQACYHKPVRRFVIEKLVDVYIRQSVAEEPANILQRSYTGADQHTMSS